MAKFQAPKGTRDLYPEDVLRQRYITQAWRDVSIRHGFDEIAGPTFEHLDLYTVKSGEGIVSELFSFRREGGDDDYALRPEFTPTLARMYAARARQLPQPTKWFTAGPYFRAEKPQRGRLREFLQWNVDVMGLPGGLKAEDAEALEGKAQADTEVMATCVDLLAVLGFSDKDADLRISHRGAIGDWLLKKGIEQEKHEAVLGLLDAVQKLPLEAIEKRLVQLGLGKDLAAIFKVGLPPVVRIHKGGDTGLVVFASVKPLLESLLSVGLNRRAIFDLSIVRGLAYYTGTVFEIIAEGERAVCGGGRYDRLVEMFGGPATPAVGFGMGDVVMSLLLDDKGLMPEGAELMEAAGRPSASVRPEAFVIAGGETTDADVNKAVAMLRRGPEKLDDGTPAEELKAWRRPAGLHARRSYKSTRNVGKLLKDATNQHARFAVILENAEEATIKNLDTGEQSDVKYAVGDELRTELFRRLGR